MKVAAVVPTLGASPHLERCLAALAEEGATTVVVAQGELGGIAADRVVRSERPLGFAVAVNRGLDATAEGLVAVVNDDAIVEPGWSEVLRSALEEDPAAGAVQGIQLCLEDPRQLDGAGIAWNRWWQAVQLGQGEPATTVREPREIFGVSATAALLRREAILRLREHDGYVFDPRLDSYYEDVDLAGRLRRLGYTALCHPAARALHAGGATSEAAPRWREIRIRGNRYAVLARLLGRSLWPRLPLLLLRDLLDARPGGDGSGVGVALGLARGLRLLPRFAHLRPCAPGLAELRRFRVG